MCLFFVFNAAMDERGKNEYAEIPQEDIREVNILCRSHMVQSIISFRHQQIFQEGMILLLGSQRKPTWLSSDISSIKKHYERLTISIYKDFLMYGFSILQKKNKGDDVFSKCTTHLDLQALTVRVRPYRNSTIFSPSDLEYLILEKRNLKPLKDCFVLEHPLWKPRSSGYLYSPVASLLPVWREQTKQLVRAQKVAETLSRVNIFYEDMPEMYALVDHEHRDKSNSTRDTYLTEDNGEKGIEALASRVTQNTDITDTKTKSIVTIMGLMSQDESTVLRQILTHDAVYSGLLSENLAPIREKIMHEQVIPVNTYRAPRGTRIHRIQMPCDFGKSQNRGSTTAASLKGDAMNSAYLDIKKKTDAHFEEQALRVLEVSKGEFGQWVWLGNNEFIWGILQDAICSIINSDAEILNHLFKKADQNLE